MTDELLPVVLPSVVQGLQDVDDDVRAVAAAALNPVAAALIRVCNTQVRNSIQFRYTFISMLL